MKKLFLMIAALLMTVTASAQFQAGKGYIGSSLTGLDLRYNGADDLNLGVEAKAGYLFQDNWMMLGMASFEHNGSDAVADHFTVGAGLRYYIIQNGLYLGANAKFTHANHNYNDLMPGVEVGYAFFINRSVTIEPAVYYDQSFKNSDYSTIGLKIGIGIYLFDD
ncbi:MAG: hypothetical protein MSD82_09835 [Prevotella sp.]|nr:hypothetical protein [Prevotella sp.]